MFRLWIRLSRPVQKPFKEMMYNPSSLSFCGENSYNSVMLSKDEVEKVALLARIELRDGEVEKFQKDLSIVLDYVEELKQVDVEGLEIVSQVTGLENVQRDDLSQAADNHEATTKNAPALKDGYYKVRSIL